MLRSIRSRSVTRSKRSRRNGPGRSRNFCADFPSASIPLIHLLAVSTICAERLRARSRAAALVGSAGNLRFRSRAASDETRVGIEHDLSRARRFSRFALMESAGDDYASRCAKSRVSHRSRKPRPNSPASPKLVWSPFTSTPTLTLRARYGPPATEFAALGLGQARRSRAES